MKRLTSVVSLLKGLCEKYPAVVLGYFLIGYSFIAVVRLLIRAKKGAVLIEDLYDVFSALPFMWLLALSIVQIIHERSRLHQIENELARVKLQRQMTELRLASLKEAEKALQHSINNPLAVISLSLSRLKRAVEVDRDLLNETNDIECASKTIVTVLTDFSRTQLQ